MISKFEARSFEARSPRFRMPAPQLIIFEGVDAAGKSAVCGRYLLSLENVGISAKLLSFPGKASGTLGSLVYRLHHSPMSVGVNRLTPASLQALHIAAHLDAIETEIVPSLNAGETIVLDRYWWSTWVYGMVGGIREEILQSLIEAERLAWGRWQPDLVFHVARSSPLRNEPADTWGKLVRGYHQLVEREAGKYPIHVLPNDGSLEETVAAAIAHSHGR